MKKRTFLHYFIIIVSGLILSSCSRRENVNLVGNYHNKYPHEQKVTTVSDETMTPLPAPSDLSASSSYETEPVAFARTTEHHSTIDRVSDRKDFQKKSISVSSDKKLVKENLSKKDIKRALKSNSADDSVILYVILAILLPPLAVALYEDGITSHFWIDILLTLLFWIPGVIYALILIL